ncbi:hypothetical protein [Streptomyces sp. NPDC057838]|uniref:hypothetical protein n=1 Tax=unclassified Streptomyces TaxID=2593676 RepID=UPI0036973B8A
MADKIYAPYARAAAVVAADGQLRKQKNVVQVQRTGTGRYRLTVPETIDLPTAAMHVTADAGADWGTEVYVRPVKDHNHTAEVLTSKSGVATNEPFHFSVL